MLVPVADLAAFFATFLAASPVGGFFRRTALLRAGTAELAIMHLRG
jgi:hypothetical protein